MRALVFLTDPEPWPDELGPDAFVTAQAGVITFANVVEFRSRFSSSLSFR